MKNPLLTDAIARIHDGTACYTVAAEVEALLDAIDWPRCGGLLADPGCGSGNMVVAALARLDLPVDDIDAAIRRVRGTEFHHAAVAEARQRVSELLVMRGWRTDRAEMAAGKVVAHGDFLLDDDHPIVDIFLANPPYMRSTRLPPSYRDAMDRKVPLHARGDVLHAYLDRMATLLSPAGVMAVISSDRWLLNAGTRRLRDMLGTRFGVQGLRRLDSASAFHRPKTRARNTPPRVHAVSMVLAAGGRPLGAKPFQIDLRTHVDGVPFGELVDLRLAPYLGPDGVFMVDADSGLPGHLLVPCIEPRDICPHTGTIAPTRRWAIVTGDERPPEQVMAHLDRTLDRMPASARRKVPWLPPERFDRHLPLDHDAVLVPRIAQRLRTHILPRGHLPTNHSLVVATGMATDDIVRMLGDPRVMDQADAMALRIEGGFKSFTATLLRALVIPHDIIPKQELEKAA